MIVSKSFTARQIAEAADCSIRGVKRFRSNMRFFGSMKAPQNGGGRRRFITPSMLVALCEHLFDKPNQYLDEMALYLWNEFEVAVSTSAVDKPLKPISWCKKTCRRVAQDRNANLRDCYMYQLSPFRSYQLVYVNDLTAISGLVSDGRLITARDNTGPDSQIPT
jgi:transposase